LTCYFRHLQAVFEKAGIEVTKENKQELDKLIHKIVSVKYKDCPNTGREVKKRIAADEEGFIAELKKQWSKHA
jgi:ribosomal protein L17